LYFIEKIFLFDLYIVLIRSDNILICLVGIQYTVLMKQNHNCTRRVKYKIINIKYLKVYFYTLKKYTNLVPSSIETIH